MFTTRKCEGSNLKCRMLAYQSLLFLTGLKRLAIASESFSTPNKSVLQAMPATLNGFLCSKTLCSTVATSASWPMHLNAATKSEIPMPSRRTVDTPTSKRINVRPTATFVQVRLVESVEKDSISLIQMSGNQDSIERRFSVSSLGKNLNRIYQCSAIQSVYVAAEQPIHTVDVNVVFSLRLLANPFKLP